MTDEQRETLRRNYRERSIPEVGRLQALSAAKKKERDDARNAWPTAMVMRQASPTRDTQIRIRGQYSNKGEKVDPGVPSSLFAWCDGLPANRLGLARWLTDPGHPLTARVTVNQYWQRFFGSGIVKTAEDFGSQGEWPSHPELSTGWHGIHPHRLGHQSHAAPDRNLGHLSPDSVVSKELPNAVPTTACSPAVRGCGGRRASEMWQ